MAPITFYHGHDHRATQMEALYLSILKQEQICLQRSASIVEWVSGLRRVGSCFISEDIFSFISLAIQPANQEDPSQIFKDWTDIKSYQGLL